MRCRQPGSIRIHFLLALGAAGGVAGMARELPLGEGVGASALEQGTAMLSKPGAHAQPIIILGSLHTVPCVLYDRCLMRSSNLLTPPQKMLRMIRS